MDSKKMMRNLIIVVVVIVAALAAYKAMAPQGDLATPQQMEQTQGSDVPPPVDMAPAPMSGDVPPPPADDMSSVPTAPDMGAVPEMVDENAKKLEEIREGSDVPPTQE